MMIVDPVILRPLREEWVSIKAQLEPLAKRALDIVPKSQGRGDIRDADLAVQRARAPAIALRDMVLDRLASIRILDPACGSGNFLYLAFQGVKDIENRVVLGQSTRRRTCDRAAELLGPSGSQWKRAGANVSCRDAIEGMRRLKALHLRNVTSTLRYSSTRVAWPG
jgi:MmeI, DNA-methyltransferase domain